MKTSGELDGSWSSASDISFVMISMIHSQGAPTNVEWPVAAGSPGGMRYSPLKQINASNVNQLAGRLDL